MKNSLSTQQPIAGDELRADFMKIGETMSQEWLQRAGESGKAVIDAYKAM